MSYIITNILQTPTDHKKVKPDASGANVPDGGVSHSGTEPGKSGTSIDNVSVKRPAGIDNTRLRSTANTNNIGYGGTGNLRSSDSYASNSAFENQNSIGDKHVEWVYTTVDAAGVVKQYGTYDSTKDLVKFKSFGLSLSLFVFSIYLFYVSARLYHQYFDKNGKEKYFAFFFLIAVVFANTLWVWVLLEMKGIPTIFLLEEFLRYPDQFIFVLELASLLLLTIGVLRFTLIAFLPNSEENEKKLKDSRFSVIGIVVGMISVTANIIKIWEAFKK